MTDDPENYQECAICWGPLIEDMDLDTGVHGDCAEEERQRSRAGSGLPGVEYVDHRGIEIADSEWLCPNCGEDGELMKRTASKNTCAKCFWVVGGRNNDYELRDWPLKYRTAQRLLAAIDEPWHGTPGDIGTRLRQLFDEPKDVAGELEQIDQMSEGYNG